MSGPDDSVRQGTLGLAEAAERESAEREPAPPPSPASGSSCTSTRLMGNRAVADTFDRLLDERAPDGRRGDAEDLASSDTLQALAEGDPAPPISEAQDPSSSSVELPTQEYHQLSSRDRWMRSPAGSARPAESAELTDSEAAAAADEAAIGVSEHGEESHVIGSRYRIVESIGMGGMGAIFKVRHLELGKIFALKIILSELSSDTTVQRFFYREAQVLSQLSHPNIVQVTDFGTDEAFGAFLVMEFLKGESLYERLEREAPLSTVDSLRIAIQTARAVEYMHSRELTHCDIKPENIFLCADPTDRPRVKVIDFGLSRHVARGAELVASEVAATPVYAAPEQLAGVAPRPSMDIYGVGAVLYEMISGLAPFDGTLQEILEAKESTAVAPPSEHLDSPLAPPIEDLILSTLERKPTQRCTDMETLITGLREALLEFGDAGRTTLPGMGRSRGGEALPSLPNDVVEARVFCQRFPLPLVLLSTEGTIRAASPTFCNMMHAESSDLQDRSIASTRLGVIFPDIEGDLALAAEGRQQILRRFDHDSPNGSQSAISVWIAPTTGDHGEVDGFWGILVPAVDREP